MKLSMTVRVCAGVWNNISLPLLGSGRRVDVFMAVVVLGLNVGTVFRSHLCILGDPGAVSRVDKMFVVKVYCKTFSGQSEASNSNASGTGSVTVSAQGLVSILQ